MNKCVQIFLLLTTLYSKSYFCNGKTVNRNKISSAEKSAAQTEVRRLERTDFSIIHKSSMLTIDIYENYQNVIDKFGLPRKTNRKDGEPEWICLEYDSFSAYYYEHSYNQNILLLQVFDDTFAMPRGISVGDNISKVLKSYSKDEMLMSMLNTGEKFCCLEISIPVEDKNKPPFTEWVLGIYFFFDDNDIIEQIHVQFTEYI